MSRANTAFVTLCGIGFFPAPGTFGSIFSTFLAFPIALFSPNTMILCAILAVVLAIPAIKKYHSATHDAPEIVIDELCGMFFTISIVSAGSLPEIFASQILNFAIFCTISLIFFRIFDIFKPGIIGRIDRSLKTSFGVVLDDVLAGIFAGICTLLLAKILKIAL